MPKHLLFKLILLFSLILLSSCNKLRELEDISCPKITIDFHLEDSLTMYSGIMTFEYVNNSLNSLESAGFYLLPNDIGGSLTVNSVKVNSMSINYKTTKSVCHIDFPQTIDVGESVTIDISFKGLVPPALELPGIFFSNEGTIALGSFYPLPIPFNDTGSFDIVNATSSGDVVESILSKFSVTFTAPKDLEFAASGRVERGDVINNLRSYSVKTGPVRDFFLVGSNKWGKVTKTTNGIELISWFPKGKMQQGINALYNTEYALSIFEDRLTPYPYNSMSIVSAPLGSYVAGMEYPGIIVIHNNFYANERSNALEWTLAHEVGHQWFYNLVGNDPIAEPWLDEAFTQYLTWLYFENRYGRNSGDSVYNSFNNRWKRVMKKTMALNLRADEYNKKEYGAIPYGKGPLFLFTLRYKFGEELFNEFLINYLNDFRWKRVTTKTLQKYMYNYFSEEGDLLFRKWVYEEDI